MAPLPSLTKHCRLLDKSHISSPLLQTPVGRESTRRVSMEPAARLVPRACLWNGALGLVFCGLLACRGQVSEAPGPPLGRHQGPPADGF